MTHRSIFCRQCGSHLNWYEDHEPDIYEQGFCGDYCKHVWEQLREFDERMARQEGR